MKSYLSGMDQTKYIPVLLILCYFLFIWIGEIGAAENGKKSKEKAVFRVPIDDKAFNIVSQLYAYDSSLPLESETIGVWPWRNPYTIEKIKYRSTHSEIVPGYFAYPNVEKSKKLPAVLLIHGNNDFWGKNEDWSLDWLDVLLKSGRCVLVIDNYGFGERKKSKEKRYNARHDSSLEWREIAVQSVTDLRRGIDYLLTRPEVDPNSIGLLGGSRGAYFGTLVSGLDKRLGAVVLTVGDSWDDDPQDSIIRYNHPLNFASRISAPVVMVNASKDRFVKRQKVEELFNAINSSKKHIWYDSDHYLPPKEYNKEILEWLDIYLK